MEFNPSKCQVLHITLSRNPIRYSYTMHGQTLESVENVGYLGGDISSDLGCSHHISRITSNAKKKPWFSQKKHKNYPFWPRLAGKYRWREFPAVITVLGNTPNFGKVGNTRCVNLPERTGTGLITRTDRNGLLLFLSF